MNLGDVQLTVKERVLVAHLTGEVDLSNAQAIEEAILLATPNHAVGVIFDLSEAEYIDSAGIQVLYRLREQLQNRGQELKLVIPGQSPAADALRLAGITQHLNITTTVREALAEEPSPPGAGGHPAPAGERRIQ